MTQYKIVLVPFPFDDLSSNKVRPAVCLTEPIGPHAHVVLAFITSQVPTKPMDTDIVLNDSAAGFSMTGLRVSSTIQVHRLITVTKTLLVRELGELPSAWQTQIDERLRLLFARHK